MPPALSSLKGFADYEFVRTLGRGQFGQVKLARHVPTGIEVAVKVMRKSDQDATSLALVKREAGIMKLLRHPNIVRLYEAFDTEDQIFLVMEYAAGGELMDLILTHGGLREAEAARLFAQIALAIAYCHARHTVHRDIKAENILLDDDMNVKLIDFGLSNLFRPGVSLRTYCGSPSYAAPELVYRRGYEGPEVDCWALGVLLFVMLTGDVPFKAPTYPELYRKINCARYYVPESLHLSSDCIALLRSMLQPNIAVRANIQAICNSPWLAHWVTPPLRSLSYIDNTPDSDAPENQKEKLHEPTLLRLSEKGYSREDIEKALVEEPYGDISATYYLTKQSLLQKKQQHMSALGRNTSFTAALAKSREKKNKEIGQVKTEDGSSSAISSTSKGDTENDEEEKHKKKKKKKPSSKKGAADAQEGKDGDEGESDVPYSPSDASQPDTPSTEKTEDSSKACEVEGRPRSRSQSHHHHHHHHHHHRHNSHLPKDDINDLSVDDSSRKRAVTSKIPMRHAPIVPSPPGSPSFSSPPIDYARKDGSLRISQLSQTQKISTTKPHNNSLSRHHSHGSPKPGAGSPSIPINIVPAVKPDVSSTPSTIDSAPGCSPDSSSSSTVTTDPNTPISLLTPSPGSQHLSGRVPAVTLSDISGSSTASSGSVKSAQKGSSIMARHHENDKQTSGLTISPIFRPNYQSRTVPSKTAKIPVSPRSPVSPTSSSSSSSSTPTSPASPSGLSKAERPKKDRAKSRTHPKMNMRRVESLTVMTNLPNSPVGTAHASVTSSTTSGTSSDTPSPDFKSPSSVLPSPMSIGGSPVSVNSPPRRETGSFSLHRKHEDKTIPSPHAADKPPPGEPRTARFAMSLKTTSSLPPGEIMSRVRTYLHSLKGIFVEDVSSFLVVVTLPPTSEMLGPDHDNHDKGLTVEIEVCRAFILSLNGLRFHRISGDSLSYKFFCNKIIETVDLSK